MTYRVPTEDDIEDAKRDAWHDANVRECPECGGELVLIERHAATRVDPGCELWQCKCGAEQEG